MQTGKQLYRASEITCTGSRFIGELYPVDQKSQLASASTRIGRCNVIEADLRNIINVAGPVAIIQVHRRPHP